MVESITIRPEPLYHKKQIDNNGVQGKSQAPAPSAPKQEVGSQPSAFARSADYFANRYGDKSISRRTADFKAPDTANAAATQTASSDGPDFYDFLDIINPLQHIPGVSSIYRELTGDEIKPEFKLAGGGLFGGPIGFVLSAVDAIVAKETGKDVGETVLALFDGDATANTKAQLAAAQPGAPLPAAQKLVEANLARQVEQAESPTAASIVAPLPSSVPFPPAASAPQQPLLPQINTHNLPPKLPDILFQKDATNTPAVSNPTDRDLISLFGSGKQSAHQSYQRVDLLKYLNDVSVNEVL